MRDTAEEVVSCLFDSSTGLFLSPTGFDAAVEARCCYSDREFIDTAKRAFLAGGLTTVVEVVSDVEVYRGCIIARPIIDGRRGRVYVAYIPLSVMGPAGRPTNSCFNIGPGPSDVKQNLDMYRRQDWIKDNAN